MSICGEKVREEFGGYFSSRLDMLNQGLHISVAFDTILPRTLLFLKIHRLRENRIGQCLGDSREC